MGAPSAGDVVLVPFPFSDLSQSKMRPADCVANAGRGDFVLCQITSNPYGDKLPLTLDAADFDSGSLQVTSFVRPGKLFTANRALIVRTVGELKAPSLRRVIDAVIALLSSNTRA